MEEYQKYNCIIIDDEFLARKLIADYISKIDHLNLVGSFDTPTKTIDIITKGNVDVIFTDIEMTDISGIDFIQELSVPNQPIIVFITAYPQYAVQGFEINAVEYLLKPVSFPRFVKAVNKITTILKAKQKLQLLENSQPPIQPVIEKKGFVIIKNERKIVKLLHEEILFIEGALEYVTFQTRNKKIMGLFSLKNLEKELPEDKFMRIHKSYIVALDKISEIDGNLVKIEQFTIAVSKAIRPKLLKAFSK
jgi:DNA-binding LytR/AlgR family response regulator